MLILLIINIVIILWIYLKYYDAPKNKELQQEYKKEKIEKMDPLIMGYIYDEGFKNNFDLILAEIVNLNIKGYIKIEYDRNDINAYNYVIKPSFDINVDNISKYEIIVLDFLFSKNMEITKKELEQKLMNESNIYNVQYKDLQKAIQKELIEEHILDNKKNEELKKIAKVYKKISILSIITVLIIKIFVDQQISTFSILTYMIEKIISNILIIKANKYTEKGKKIKKDIIIYKNTIENKEFLENTETMNTIVLEKEFANSIALHINTQAKIVFIDDIITKNAIKNAKIITIELLIIISIFAIIGIILGKITKSISKDGIIWLYIMLVIFIAFAADITKIFAITKNKRFKF